VIIALKSPSATALMLRRGWSKPPARANQLGALKVPRLRRIELDE
jgi:hypothetical protein